MLGLYVHVPFCSAICSYCNFNRGLFDAALKARYVDAVVSEIRYPTPAGPWAVGPEPHPVDTIYFGGGTPSLLDPGDVRRIIQACETQFQVAADREVTLEANPESVSVERLAAFRAAGVNRLSFGVQSFREDELRMLTRLHSATRAADAVAEARAAGFDNLSLDLMMWLPGQRLEAWLSSVERAIALRPDHLSAYMLEVYPNAPLKEDMARAGASQAPDADVADMYEAAMARLDAAGLLQYEISNAARPGYESRHNLKYWTDGEWIGFGCGAHSTFGRQRWKNVAATEDYIERMERGQSAAVEERGLSEEERLGEALFMGLRLARGVDLAAVEARYGVDVQQRFGADLEPFLAEGLLRLESGRLSLTRRGMLLAHEIMAVFV